MKTQKKLNIALTILVIILVSLISFVGIYHLDKNQMVSSLPNYILGTDASGYRFITLVPSEIQTENENESIDLGEAKVEDNSIETENNIENENTENTVEDNSAEKENEKLNNYKKAEEVFRARLKALKIDDFILAFDNKTGKIELSLPENEQTDIILSDLVQKGNFEVSDTNTGEVLLTNKDVKSVNVRATDTYGYSIVGMDINFNLNGTKIFKNITEQYNSDATVIVNAVDNETAEDSTDESDNNVSEATTEENATQENTSEENTSEENATDENTTDENAVDESGASGEEVKKTIDLKIDDTVMLSTSFDEVIDSGKLELSMGSYVDANDLQSALYGGYNIAAIIENDPLPIDYEVTGNIYVGGRIQTSDINTIIYVLIGIGVIISIAMIIKFKMKGVLSTILSVGYIAVLLIALRYTNVTLSLEGIFAIGFAFILDLGFYYVLFEKLKDKKLTREEKIENYDKTLKKYCMSIIPLIILSIICCFINWDSIYSFGMVTFWAIDISILYNLIVTNFIIRSK